MATITCPSCGVPAPQGGLFCSQCAAPLTGSSRSPQPAGTRPPEPPRRSRIPAHRRSGLNGWIKLLIAALSVGVVAAVAVAVVLAVGAHRATDKLNAALTPKPGRPPGYHGPGYAGMLVQDHIAARPNAALDLLGETVTAGDLTRTPSFLGPTLCSAVTVTNHGPGTRDVGPAEWKLQQPNGVVATFAITGTLQSGQLAPGGRARGTACFADSGQSGVFQLLWQPLFRVDRGVWILRF